MTGDSAGTKAITEIAEADGPGAAGTIAAAGTVAAAGTGTGAEAAAGTSEDAEELLVEEISIDGMCGVY